MTSRLARRWCSEEDECRVPVVISVSTGETGGYMQTLNTCILMYSLTVCLRAVESSSKKEYYCILILLLYSIQAETVFQLLSWICCICAQWG